MISKLMVSSGTTFACFVEGSKGAVIFMTQCSSHIDWLGLKHHLLLHEGELPLASTFVAIPPSTITARPLATSAKGSPCYWIVAANTSSLNSCTMRLRCHGILLALVKD
jgi:hypothetical protein